MLTAGCGWSRYVVTARDRTARSRSPALQAKDDDMRDATTSGRHRFGRIATAMVIAWCAALPLLLLAQSTPPPLTLVSTAWTPFTNDPGRPRFALDLIEAALGRFGMTAKTTIVSPAEFTRSLLQGGFDGSGAAWKDAERERSLIFSEPYLENRLILVGRRGADVSAGTLGDLKGKRIAIVEGYSYGEAIEKAGPVIVRSSGEEDSLARLLAGSVDYTLMDELVIEYIVNNYPKESEARLQLGARALITRELFFAVRRVRADAEAIVARFNAQLRGMIVDRTYHRLLQVTWIRADVTGDGVPEYVPLNDHPGPTEPRRAYSLFSAPPPTSFAPPKTGFYVGGSLYSDWATVPDRYKAINSTEPDPRRSTGTIFTFRW
jgi:polar amino acid transport system substrate-binding protein